MNNPFGGSPLLPATNQFAPPPPPVTGPDPHAAWHPQPTLAAALRAAFFRARAEWRHAFGYGLYAPCSRFCFDSSPAYEATEALTPHLPPRLASIVGGIIANLTCPLAIRWPQLCRGHGDPG